MGEAKRRKQSDPSWGKSTGSIRDLERIINTKYLNNPNISLIKAVFEELTFYDDVVNDLSRTYFLAKEQYKNPCVIVFPANDGGLDAVPGDFIELQKFAHVTDEDYLKLVDMYNNRTKGQIAFCLFNTDISTEGNMAILKKALYISLKDNISIASMRLAIPYQQCIEYRTLS